MSLPSKKYTGKLFGAILGFLIGGTWVACLIGLFIGHLSDRQEEKASAWTGIWNKYNGFSAGTEQAVFTIGVVVLSAKMAKTDGRVNRAEIDAFKRVFRISPQREAEIGEIFDQARLSSDGFEPYAFQLARVFNNSPEILEEILTGLFIIGAADNASLNPPETRFLQKVSFIFGFDSQDFFRIAARAGIHINQPNKPEKTQSNELEVLGLEENATNEQIKAAYRSLIMKHHPDKLMAQGLPPEFVATATEKMKRINVAYGTICKERGIK